MIENKTQVLTNLRARIGLMLSLLSSIFVCCNQQEGNAKQFLPIDTIVSGFILDDYAQINNNDDFLKSYNKQLKKIQNGDTLVYTIKNEYYPYHCEYKFIKGRLKYYEFDYRDP